MQVWSFCINDNPAQPDLAAGFVRAETVEDALELIDDPRCNLYDIPGDVDGLHWPSDGPGVVYEPSPTAGSAFH